MPNNLGISVLAEGETGVAVREIRSTRVEDWNGNIYNFESSSSGTAGTIVSGSDVTEGGITNSDGESIDDSNANGGKAIVVVSDPSTDKTIIKTKISDLPFGKISIQLRLKSSVGNGTTPIIAVNCYYFDNTNTDENYNGILLSTTNITGNQIGVAGEYLEIGLVTDYKGIYTTSKSLMIEALLKANTNATVYFDYLAAQKSYTGVTGTATQYI